NQPFAGGYISRHYGQSNVPWAQVELNRALYLSPPWFDRDSLTMDENRLQELKQTFEKTLILFFERGTNARDRRG
ncbi:N-formylglutamate amidohydrolase, partial [candidate division KSB1 bacterium]|nr:N-formylglutamate amidohydrolase [candidate division KSB1 bacterium]NIR69985.1 N-formylglutamate amidohydrolase [candidate division KSB1 bacterium]NIS25885.1 N-formylglutamate amidohydrolase [candidate division KSB1 bacterium]NIT72761.1 N-formylglutamate amidohydrolase [candidate division KSB1 bacterium]NIU26573.1 N-formylglutamate amidohydrolase [candidate division KSB1 bacterium]